MSKLFFLIYAFLGVRIKIIAIKRISLEPLFSLYIYICIYLVLYEMTQIRAGVASGIFLLALKDIKNKNLYGYLFKTLLASSFHYSALMMIFVYFLNPKKINVKIYITLPIMGMLLSSFEYYGLLILKSISSLFPSYIGNKLNMYLLLLNNQEWLDINIFNFYYLSLLFIYYFSIFNYKKMKSEYDILLIKILGLTLFMFYLLSFIPVMAFRISEFFGIVLIFLLAHLTLIFKEKRISNILIFIWLSIYFWAISINTLTNF